MFIQGVVSLRTVPEQKQGGGRYLWVVVGIHLLGVLGLELLGLGNVGSLLLQFQTAQS
jgi:hypothetical protein